VTFSNSAPDPEVDSNAVQDFMASMEDAFRAHPLWAGSSEEELESAGEVNFMHFENQCKSSNITILIWCQDVQGRSNFRINVGRGPENSRLTF
jgi:Domain of unknown function (DUF5601)